MFEKELERMILAGKKASQKIVEIYRKGFSVQLKEDKSPVTDADLASDKIIREHLSVFSDISFLSEEEIDDKERLNKRKLFIVDPLDGTSDFVAKDDEFSINIALVVDHLPVCSVLFMPVDNTYAYALKGKGSYFVSKSNVETRLHVSNKIDKLDLLVSRSHVNEKEKQLIERKKDLINSVTKMGASRKGVYLAMGKYDACIRFTKETKEWDVCAPDLIVREAGGCFTDTNFKPFIYNRENVYNEFGYVMLNRKENQILLS